jgi:hypothetical protein
MKMLSGVLKTAAITTVCVCIALTGCRKTKVGTNALAPHKAGPIKDLTAIRVGDEIYLNWTTPRKGLSKIAFNGSMNIRVCRLETPKSECIEAGRPLRLALGAPGAFAEAIPAPMASGPPRVAYYSVEFLDRNGGSSGFANRIPVLIGAPPVLVQNLTAEMTEKGVVLRWKPEPTGTEAGETLIRFRRTDGIDPPVTQAMRDGLVPFPTRPEVELSAQDGSASATDSSVQRTEIYQYRAQRVFRILVEKQTLEMDGQFSNEVEVNAPNVHQ